MGPDITGRNASCGVSQENSVIKIDIRCWDREQNMKVKTNEIVFKKTVIGAEFGFMEKAGLLFATVRCRTIKQN